MWLLSLFMQFSGLRHVLHWQYLLLNQILLQIGLVGLQSWEQLEGITKVKLIPLLLRQAELLQSLQKGRIGWWWSVGEITLISSQYGVHSFVGEIFPICKSGLTPNKIWLFGTCWKSSCKTAGEADSAVS